MKFYKLTRRTLFNINAGTFFLLFFLLGLVAQPQESTFKAGLLGGITSSQIEGDSFGGFDKFGINGGAFVSTSLTPKFNASLEMYYINKGSRKNATKNNPFYESIRLNYIEIPIMLRYNFKRFSTELGLSYGYLVNQKFLDNGIEYTPISYRYFKKYEIGGLVGIKYWVKANLAASFRISQSVLPVRNFSFYQQPYFIIKLPSGTTNFALSLSLYYTFARKLPE